MSRQKSITILRGVKTSLFLLAVIGVSSLVSLSSPRPAQAEGLLYGLTCTVSGLLGRSCTTTPEPTSNNPPSPTPSGGTKPDTAKPGSGTTKEPSPTGPPTAQQVGTPAPVQLDEGLLEDVPSVASVQPTSGSYTFPAHIAPIAKPGSDSAILGQAATAPIEASHGGWMILGVSWAWWVGAAALVFAGAYAGKKLVAYRKVAGVAKSS